jgi:hypothetical protein
MTEVYEQLDRAAADGGAAAALRVLEARALEEKNYPLLFELRILEKRRELGLPLVQTELPGSLPEAAQKAYDAAFVAAAREVGGLFLAAGQIGRAWPYFRAIGDPAPVARAIETGGSADEAETLIAIALGEGVHPQKGFDLVLQHQGTCRAISTFDQLTGRDAREYAARVLVRTLHGELVERLQRAIAGAEGAAPDSRYVPDLIAGRDWLFGEFSYYVDTSHLVSVLRISLDLDDAESLRLALELAEYGKHLSPNFQFKMEPPFDDSYNDTAIYLRALLGEEADAAVEHFRRKAFQENPQDFGQMAAQVLVGLLARLRRFSEAIDVAVRFLADIPPQQLACPSAAQLCQMAGDFTRLKEVSRGRGDLIGYAAALLQSPA